MTTETFFNISVVIFTVGNLAAMGLELNVREAIKFLRSAKFVILVFTWSWIVGPAFAYLITKILPLAEPYALGLLLAGPLPCAPFYPLVVRRAKGDVAVAASFLLLTTAGAVVIVPFLLPFIIPNLTVSAGAIAKPLLTMMLVPLLAGIAVRGLASGAADRIFPWVKRMAGIFTLLVLVLVLVRYGAKVLDSLGSFAIAAQLLFLCGMTFMSYKASVGFGREQRSVIALGTGTRNIAAVFAVLMAMPAPDPRLVVMVVLVIPISAIVSFGAAHLFAKRPG